MTYFAAINRDLLDVAERLADEYREEPTGSVLRCYARAVRKAHRQGTPLEALPTESERLARISLGWRTVPAGLAS